MGCIHSRWASLRTCYFCNKKEKSRDITLADGCTVPACLECFYMIDEARRVAQERGLYDPNASIGGGENMKIEKGATGGRNLTVDFVTERKLTKLKIIDEGEMVTYPAKEDGKGPRDTL